MDVSKRLLQNLFCSYRDKLIQQRQPLKNLKAIDAISRCRTREMGVSYFSCKDRHEVVERTHSCRHRSCHLCASQARLKWVEAQKERLFNCPHFHVIFTMPHEYLALWQYNEAWFTSTIFNVSSDTLMTLIQSDQYHGVTPGLVIALHTWGRQLNLHPHTHCLVTAGGLTKTGEWRSIDDYLLPGRVVRSLYRGRFQGALKRAFEAGELVLPPDMDAATFWRIYRKAYQKTWSVRIEERYDHGKGLMLYLSRYLKGGPLHPAQIKYCDADQALLHYKDHRDQRIKPLRLRTQELVRRLLLHVPVTGAHTVRHYGLYASSAKAKREYCCQLFGNLVAFADSSGVSKEEMVILCRRCGAPMRRTHSVYIRWRKGISYNKSGDLPPKKVAVRKETCPLRLTLGRSQHEAQTLHRRTDHRYPE